MNLNSGKDLGMGPWQDLGQLTAELAIDGIRIQQRLDAAAALDTERFARLLSAVPQSMHSVLLPLAPARLQLTEHRVSCTLRTTVSHEAGFSILVAPIQMGGSTLFDTTSAVRCSVTIEVRAVPTILAQKSSL